MSGATYAIDLCDPFGNLLADASGFSELQAARVVNDVGSLILTYPDWSLLPFLTKHNRLRVWRTVQGWQQLLFEADWIVTRQQRTIAANGTQTLILTARSPLWVLTGRSVLSFAGSANAQITAPADDLIKQIIRNEVSAAGGSRQISQVQVAANLSAASTMTKAFAWRPVLPILQEVARASTQAGIYLAFDLVSVDAVNWQFRTYTGQRGTDQRTTLLIGADYGNLTDSEIIEDNTDEVTATTAGGQGEGADRTTGTASDTARIGESPFSYRETFVQSTEYLNNASGQLTAEAQSAVRAGRPRITIAGNLLDTPQARFGVDWNWGDYVTATMPGNVQFAARVDSVSIQVARGLETINAGLRYDNLG